MRVDLLAKITSVALVLVGVGLFRARGAAAFDLSGRSALWHVVNDLCRPMQTALDLPLPCLKVDTELGYAVLRAPGDATQILVAPTARIEGIESPALLRDRAPNLWSDAWSERERVVASAPRPLDWSDIGMAVNSLPGRSQDLLHLHVDCVNWRLKRALAARAGQSFAKWAVFDVHPWAGRYRVADLGADGVKGNIFKMIADEIPGAKSRMAQQSVAVVGVIDANGERSFVALVNSHGGHAEELLDHSCSGGE